MDRVGLGQSGFGKNLSGLQKVSHLRELAKAVDALLST
jgi:hypothetical protein